MSTIGLRLLAGVVVSEDIQEFKNVVYDHLKPTEQEVYSYMEEHILDFGAVPKKTTVAQKTGIKLPLSPEPTPFYRAELEKRFLTARVNESMMQVQESLSVKDPYTALDQMGEVVSQMMQVKAGSSMLDFRDAQALMEKHHKNKLFMGHFGIKSGWPYLDNRMGGLEPSDVMSIVGRPAQGKYQSLDSKVLTLFGYKKMRDIKIGDEIASIDGEPNEVIQLHPQGLKRLYEISFSDDRKVEVGGPHLWEVYYRDWDSSRVLTTFKIMELLGHKRYQNRLSIDLFSGDYGHVKPRMDAYMLGVLLGDGGFTGSTPMLSSADQEILTAITVRLPKNYSCVYRSQYDYALTDGVKGTENKIKKRLEWFGLWGLKSEKKFIPKEYFNHRRYDRLELLRGLLDTDGTAGKDGTITYCSASEQLALDVQRLVRSLGGASKIRYKPNDCQGAWIVSVMMQFPKSVFNLTRKRDRVPRVASHAGIEFTRRLTITSVKFSRKAECQCITVSHPRNLYIMDNYTVTHNTFLLLSMAQYAWMYQDKTPLIITPEMKPMKLMERLTAMHTHMPLTPITKAEMTPSHFKKAILKKMEGLKDGSNPFWIVDGAECQTIEDLFILCRQLKPDCIYYDGAYLMKHKDKRLSKWERIANTAGGLKDISSILEVPVVASYQFSKQVAKKKKSDNATPGLEDIYGSDEIAQLSSIVLGLLGDESVNNVSKKVCTLLKGRGGEKGQWNINWDFNTMDFSEIVPKKKKIGGEKPQLGSI